MIELLLKAKESLSIVANATAKDNEIKMLINAGKLDLQRQGINSDLDNDLVKQAIIMYVKANFGMVDIKEKEQAQKTYSLMCHNLGLSSNYKESGSDV